MNKTTEEFCQLSNESGLNYLAECYVFYANSTLFGTIFEISLGIFTVFFNLLVMKMIYKKKEKKTVFDRILMAHALVDLVVGGLDLPIYHTYVTLGINSTD